MSEMITAMLAFAAVAALASPAIKRRFQRLTGIAFIGFGLRLALGE